VTFNTISQADRTQLEQDLARPSATLGEERFAKYFDEGEHLTFNQIKANQMGKPLYE